MKGRLILAKCFIAILSILVLIWPAIYNGFPLLYSDSGSYIFSGFLNKVPVDRPIFYGLFLRHFSLATSLWFVIIAQATFVFFVLLKTVKKITPLNSWNFTFLITIVLSFTTGLSNYTSQIMPDFFTSLSLICFGLIVTTNKIKGSDYILFFLVIIGGIVHISNLLLILSIALLTIIYSIYKKKNIKYIARIITITLFPFVLILTVNKSYLGEYKLSRAPNIFIYGRMLETGVMHDFMIKNCNEKNYIFCNQIDKLPKSANRFIWDDKSPLFDSSCKSIDWTYCWEEKNKELGSAINGIIRSASHRNNLLKIYFNDFLSQTIDFDIGVLIPQKQFSTSYNSVKKYLSADLNRYIYAKQYKKTLDFKVQSTIQLSIVILSVFIILWYFLFSIQNPKLVQLIFIYLAGLLLNSLIVSIFSTVLDRYQSRIIWIIPLVALLIILQKFHQERRQTLKD